MTQNNNPNSSEAVPNPQETAPSTTPLASNSPITLNVKTLESQTHSISVPLSETVLQLKERLATLLEVPSPRQRLIFQGRVLRDEKELTEYALQDGHTIHLVTRPADAPVNQQNDTPRTRTSRPLRSGPLRQDTPGGYQVSIIGLDDNADTQRILQALTGNQHLDLENGPAIVHFDGDPLALRALYGGGLDSMDGQGMTGGPGAAFGFNSPSTLDGLAAAAAAASTGAQPATTPSTAAERAARLRAMMNATMTVPQGQSLPHLATIESELTRAATQLRNVQAILAHPADQLERMELEPIDVPELEAVDDDVDGDTTELARMGDILSRLSETSRTMANSLQALSEQYNQHAGQAADRVNLQQVSLRAARAMYRLASVQNTVFPMLANASFAGTSRDTATYRFQPPPRLQTAHVEIPLLNTGPGPRATHAATMQLTPIFQGIPYSVVAGGAGASTPMDLLPAAIRAHARAHARATAQNMVSAMMRGGTAGIETPAATTASRATAAPQPGSTSFAHMVLAPNGVLSYAAPPRTTSRPTTSTPSTAATAPLTATQGQTLVRGIPTDFAAAGFADFMRIFGMPATNFSGPASTQASATPTESATAAMTAVRRAGEDLEQVMQQSMQSRRRERPEEFSHGVDERAGSRRRLGPGASATDVDNRTVTTTATPSASTSSPRPAPSRPNIVRSSSNDTRRSNQAQGTPGSDSTSPVSSPTPSSPLIPSSSSNANVSPAYNLGRIGVFISAILRMVDQPREDGSPRTLADVICNDTEDNTTPLQDLVTNVAASLTVRETRGIVEGHPAPLRNIHPTLNTFIRERALMGQQLTESNLDAVAVMFANGIMNAVRVEEFLESLSPAAGIQISGVDIRRISLDVLREHFRRLIYLVVAAPSGRESNWPTFARDMILWIRDVVGAWRVAFYGLFSERDQAEAQRVATHVVGSAIHENGRRWVELSNRATNTLVNVLCANIVPRRRGEEQTGGLVGGAWPLMATGNGPRPTQLRTTGCRAPSLLGSTAPPVPLGLNAPGSSRATASSSATPSRGGETLNANLTRRLRELIDPAVLSAAGTEDLASAASLIASLQSELAAITSSATSVTPAAAAGSTPTPTSLATTTAPTSAAPATDTASGTNRLRTRVEEVEDAEMD